MVIYHASGKSSWISEDLKIWVRVIVIKSPHNRIMRIEMLSNPGAFVGFNDLIIEIISTFLIEIVFKRLSVFINNERSLRLFSKGVHWEAKYSLKISAFSTVFVIVSPDIRIGGTKGILMLFRKLFKTVQ